jgi:hypothetical protein
MLKENGKMKKYNILLAIIALVLASLACQTVMGGGDDTTLTATPPDNTGGDGTPVSESPFPMTSDAFNVAVTDETATFQTKLSVDDVEKFYRDEFAKKGYTEDTSLAVTFGSTFTMVFAGHESGRKIYVVGADAGDGSIYVTITLA